MKPKSAHVVVTDSQNRILLTQRNDVPVWVLPGGHVERGETPAAAVVRELFEETGVKVNRITPIAQYFTSKQEVIKYLFSVQVPNSAIFVKSSETRSIKWFNLHKLPKIMTLYEKKKINDFLLYKRKIINRLEKINKKQELFNQLKNPLALFVLVCHYIKTRLTTKSFKI